MEYLRDLLIQKFGEAVIISIKDDVVTIPTDLLFPVCKYLYEHDTTYFDSLSCLTAIDNGVEKSAMELIYSLYSIPYNKKLTLKVVFDRKTNDTVLPEVASVSSIWRSADWHEREAFDLMGISFSDHPDLRRILLPSDWQGYPLRKDYQAQEYYHGIKVDY